MIKIKYTRYDLKKKKKDNMIFILIILMILVLAFLIGSVFSKIFMKDKGTISTAQSKPKVEVSKNEKQSQQDKNKGIVKKNKTFNYTIVQGGIFKSDENVNKAYKKLQSYGTPFIVKQGELKRVILGIYLGDKGNKAIKTLQDKKISNSKVKVTINAKDMCDLEIGEIADAYIKIISKLEEKGVKAINTKELKKWCRGLEKVDSKNKNYKVLEELKKNIQKIPDSINRNNISQNYAFLYNMLKKIDK